MNTSDVKKEEISAKDINGKLESYINGQDVDENISKFSFILNLIL